MHPYTNKKIFLFLFLAFILVLAFFVRAYDIEQAPAGVYPDEAVNGMDAYKTLHDLQPFQWFYPDNNGREGLFINLIALSFSIFGITVFGLKFTSILLGTLTVLGVYLLTQELYRSRKAGLIAAFLVAVSFWAINFSRIAFRAEMLPFVLVFSIYFLFLGLRIKRYWPFLIGGLIFGIGLHTYIAFRIAPVILIAVFLAAWASRTNFLKTYWKHTLLFLLGSFISAAPILLTFYQHPEFLSSRSASISVFSPEINHGKPWLTLAKSIGITMQQYTVVGDMNWRHNYPPYPIVHPLVGIAFLIGLVMLVRQFFVLIYARIVKKIRDRHLEVTTLLLAWLVCMHAPEFLTYEGIPHALRAIGALPVIYIIATLPFLWLMNTYALRNNFNRIGAYLFIFAILLSVGTFNIVKYHIFWANAPEQHRSFQSNLMDIARYIQSTPKNTSIYLITGNMERIPVKLFTANRTNLTTLSPDEAITMNFPKSALLILTERNDTLLTELRNQLRNPSLEMETYQESLSDPFYIINMSD